MKTKTVKGLPAQFRRRPLALLVAVLASQGAVAADYFTVGLSNVSVNSGYTYNSGAAVCSVNSASGLAVSADVSVSPGFTVGGPSGTTFGSCTEHKTSGKTDYYYQNASYTDTVVSKQTLTVAADDTNTNSSLTGGPTTYTGTLTSPGTDGKYGVTVAAAASETVTVTPYTFERRYLETDTSCTGASTGDFNLTAGKATDTKNEGSASNTANYYYVDLAAPTVTHNVTNALQQVMQNTDLNLNIHVDGGSSEQAFKIRGGFNDGSTDVWGPEGSFSFGKSLNDGIASNRVEAAAVLVSCSVPIGTDYVSKAQLTATTDLCGQAYAPPAIDSIAQGKNGASGLFAVTENPACAVVTNQAVVTAPLPPANLLTDPPANTEESYALVACFTSQNAGSGKTKVVSYPGTVHLGTVVNSTGDGSSCDDPVAVGDVVFNLDADFDFVKTGASPQAHAFIGPADDSIGWPPGVGPGFWYHTGYPLVEIDPSLIGIVVTEDKQQLTMSLAGTELGCGPGALPKGITLYARAHAKFVGTPTPSEDHTFTTTAIGITSSIHVIENPLGGDPPLPVCVDGQFPPPALPAP
jgi:hypothetical protein